MRKAFHQARTQVHRLGVSRSSDPTRGGICNDGNTGWLFSPDSLSVIDLKLYQTLAEKRIENISTCSEISRGYFAVTIKNSKKLLILDPTRGLRVIKEIEMPFNPTLVLSLHSTAYNNLTNKNTTTTSAIGSDEINEDEIDSPVAQPQQTTDVSNYTIAVGNDTGAVFLVDVNLDMPDKEEEYYGSFESEKLTSEVTAMCVIQEIGALAIGYASGEFGLWSFDDNTQMAEGSLDVQENITHFCFQESANNEGYLWVGQATNIAQVALFKLKLRQEVSVEDVLALQLGDERSHVSSTLISCVVVPDTDREKREEKAPELSPTSPRGSQSNHNRACFVWETVETVANNAKKRTRFIRIFDLEKSSLQNKRPALFDFALTDLNPNFPILSLWIDAESLRKINDELSFNVKFLLPANVYEMELISESIAILSELEENGSEVFHNERQAFTIYRRCVELKLIKDHAKSKDLTKQANSQDADEQPALDAKHVLRSLWSLCLEHGLASSIVNYVHAQNTDSMTDDADFLLSAPTPVLAWVQYERKRIEKQIHDLMLEVRRITGHRPRSIADTDRDYRRACMNEAAQQLADLLYVMQSLAERAQEENDQESIQTLLTRITQVREHIRVLEWFTAQGFIPVASQLYNHPHMKNLWAERRKARQQVMQNLKNPGETIEDQEAYIIHKLGSLQSVSDEMIGTYGSPSENGDEDQDMGEPSLEDATNIDLPFFIDEIMKRAEENYEGDYPPADLNVLFDLFLNDNNTRDSIMYKHVAILYFLTDQTMSPSENDISVSRSMISTYAKTFNIPTSWQRLVMGLWQLDAATEQDNNQDAVPFLSAYDTPTHEWHGEIIDVLLSRKDFIAAKRISMRSRDNSVRYMRVLLSNHVKQLAFDLQRKALDDAHRRLLFFCILEYAKHTQTFASDWFSLPFDRTEERWLISYFENNFDKHDMKEIDLLFTYYVLRARYAAAIELYTKYINSHDQPGNEVRRALRDNLIKSIPKSAMEDTSYGPNTPKSKPHAQMARPSIIQVTTPQSVSKKKRLAPSTPSTLTALGNEPQRKHTKLLGNPATIALQSRTFRNQAKHRTVKNPEPEGTQLRTTSLGAPLRRANIPTQPTQPVTNNRVTTGGKSPANRVALKPGTMQAIKGPVVEEIQIDSEDEYDDDDDDLQINTSPVRYNKETHVRPSFAAKQPAQRPLNPQYKTAKPFSLNEDDDDEGSDDSGDDSVTDDDLEQAPPRKTLHDDEDDEEGGFEDDFDDVDDDVEY